MLVCADAVQNVKKMVREAVKKDVIHVIEILRARGAPAPSEVNGKGNKRRPSAMVDPRTTQRARHEFDECAHLYGGNSNGVEEEEGQEEKDEERLMSPAAEAEMWLTKWEADHENTTYDILKTVPLSQVHTYWKNKKDNYGPLMHVVRADLSTDSAAAKVERLFCDLPNFCTTKRGSTRPDKMEMMMLVRAARKKYKLTPDSLIKLPLPAEEGEEPKKIEDYIPKRLYDPVVQEALDLLFAEDYERGVDAYYLQHFD